MPKKKNIGPLPDFDDLIRPKNEDDESGNLHRMAIGFLGALLPPLVWWVSKKRPMTLKPPEEPLKSISAYFYSGSVAIFCGILLALAVFFFTYRGYKNKHRLWDILLGIWAGIAALGVALFPTEVANGLPPVLWWKNWMDTVHKVSAGALFISFILFSLFLFPRSSGGLLSLGHYQKPRNGVFIFCGLGMAFFVLWAGIRGPQQQIFWQEAIALELFAVSWLVKARIDWSVKALGARIQQPKKYVSHLRNSFLKMWATPPMASGKDASGRKRG